MTRRRLVGGIPARFPPPPVSADLGGPSASPPDTRAVHKVQEALPCLTRSLGWIHCDPNRSAGATTRTPIRTAGHAFTGRSRALPPIPTMAGLAGLCSAQVSPVIGGLWAGCRRVVGGLWAVVGGTGGVSGAACSRGGVLVVPVRQRFGGSARSDARPPAAPALTAQEAVPLGPPARPAHRDIPRDPEAAGRPEGHPRQCAPRAANGLRTPRGLSPPPRKAGQPRGMVDRLFPCQAPPARGTRSRPQRPRTATPAGQGTGMTTQGTRGTTQGTIEG